MKFQVWKYPCFPVVKPQGVSMFFLFLISHHINVCGWVEMRARVFARPWLNGSSLMSVWKAACFSCGMNLFPPLKPWINGGLFFPEVVSWVELRGLESLLPWSDGDSTWITKANTTPITNVVRDSRQRNVYSSETPGHLSHCEQECYSSARLMSSIVFEVGLGNMVKISSPYWLIFIPPWLDLTNIFCGLSGLLRTDRVFAFHCSNFQLFFYVNTC